VRNSRIGMAYIYRNAYLIIARKWKVPRGLREEHQPMVAIEKAHKRQMDVRIIRWIQIFAMRPPTDVDHELSPSQGTKTHKEYTNGVPEP
jgi:uncharacterized lipoprotein YddW (UPF0748 family)